MRLRVGRVGPGPVSRFESGHERIPEEVRQRGPEVRRDGEEAQVPREGDQEGRNSNAGKCLI